LAPRDLEEMRKRGMERADRIYKAKKNYERKYKAFMGKPTMPFDLQGDKEFMAILKEYE
jgi:nucleotidyltransferase/DNA polymerase involved in DNA repair